ncbi:DUF4245 domain-containing protein [Herbidospora galbida]|uniref:DUF4245 domain-containing protein n=1 Tax=Herbidospora galbida TaxID=2575442 RepID=A0A4U3LXW8_9ACTN|nr:DUF4245 domain-containing protein [Herbidospora galbida]TKK80682.1 DUF4245 domain-containing protein [Herbidospora galbida]
MRRFTQGLYGYAFALLVCFAGVGLFLLITPQSRTEHIPRVDFTVDADNAARAAEFPVAVPEPVLANWVPTSSRLTNTKGVLTWRLGFATGKRMHAMVAQSNEQPTAGFANRLANTETSIGTEVIKGATWEKRFREDKNQRSLVKVSDGRTVVVTGSADWPELGALAASLVERDA